MASNELIEQFDEFYRRYIDTETAEVNQFKELVEGYPSDKDSLEIDWQQLFRFSPDLADDLLEDPDCVIEAAQRAAERYDVPADIDFKGIDVRIINIDASAERKIGHFSTDDENTLREITGQLTKKSRKRQRAIEAAFECQRCGTLTHIPQTNGAQEPHECQGCERSGPFIVNHDQSTKVDYQRLRLQLPPEEAQAMNAENIDVEVEGSLVNAADVGDRVTVTAKPRTKMVSDNDDEHMLFDWYAEANHVETEESGLDEIDYEEAEDEIKEIANSDDPYQQIVESIKPTHKGDENIKLALAFQLFGGVRKESKDGSTTRGNPHVMLIGDPGTDKTGLLSYISDLAPRSVFTSGEGSSAVGLTAAVVNDDFTAGPTLEAGAMVRANNGLVAIDEFDNMSDSDQTAMNEAMSKETVSISKWGINATLRAQTTVLAAANPEYGRFDKYQAFAEQLDLDPTLLSRFDLIFIVTDKPDREDDRELASHVNQSAYVDGARQAGKEIPADAQAEQTPTIEPDLLRKYVAYARNECSPVLSEEARSFIEDEYVELRQAGSDDESDDGRVPITPRKLEALHRLAEASARIRLSETVTIDDAERAVSIVKDCLQDVGVDPETGEFDADVVETGQSQTQRRRIKSVLAIVEDNEGKTNDGAPYEAIRHEAVEMGITDEKLEPAIEKLKGQGEIYEPKDDHYRST